MNPPFRVETIHADDDPNDSDLQGVPRSFVHLKCDRVTTLTNDYIRRYLRDPVKQLKEGKRAWCAHCRKLCASSDCVWLESDMDLRTYFRALIAEAYLHKPEYWIRNAVLRAAYWELGLVLLTTVATVYTALQFNDADRTITIMLIGMGISIISTPVILLNQWLAKKRLIEEYQERYPPSELPK